MGIGRGCSIGGCAGWNLDRAVPIGEDATQRALGCVELSANHGSTVALMILMGSLVSPLLEELAFADIFRSPSNARFAPHSLS
jgi:hypothetical protein